MLQYWDWVRRASSPDRAVRQGAEASNDESFESWFAITESAEEGSSESVETIIAVALQASSPEELAYVCADLVESYEAGGGDMWVLRLRAAEEMRDLLDEIDRQYPSDK